MPSWVIGTSSECDVVVDSPLASGRHCELTQTADGFLLRDLGSTNGTFVNGVRIAGPIRLTSNDSATLGRTVPLPWPPDLTTSVRIGRLPENDIMLDDGRVSGRHARLTVGPGATAILEDLGSSNGTFLNSADYRITGPVAIKPTDTLYFGTLAVPASQLLARVRRPEPVKPPFTAVTAAVEVVPKPSAIPPVATAVPATAVGLLAWSSQVPVLAIAIVLIFGRQAAAEVTPATWASVGWGIAATSFALALAAIWLGCSLAVGAAAIGAPGRHHADNDPARLFVALGQRIAGFIGLCAVGCAVMLAIVYWGSGLKGPPPAMWGVLLLASLVGLFLGLAVAALVPNRSAAAGIVGACFLTMVVLGGCLWPLPKMNAAIQLAPAVMPSRWAFEGLFLLETPQHPAPAVATGADGAENGDLVEGFFPASSIRMGSTADVIALGSMLIGLAGLATYTWGFSRHNF
jgi:pSer/pThr/pTyr-binding forkhead associated (FHA) protein